MAPAKPFGIVIFGATGFTGEIICEYIATTYGWDTTAQPFGQWALAGRSAAKLRATRDRVAARVPPPAASPNAAEAAALLVADVRDEASLDALLRQTRVVATTVGPYAKYGGLLVARCAALGVHCCDLTGEMLWVRDMIDAHEETARKSGAFIVHSAGFDSIPSDLGTLMVADALKEARAADRMSVTYVIGGKGNKGGGASGGTIASVVGMVEDILGMARDVRKRALRLLQDPYALNPSRNNATADFALLGQPGLDGPSQAWASWRACVQAWTAPFVMAAINERVVRRSNALQGFAYGKGFRYVECMFAGKGVFGWLKAAAVSLGVPFFFLLLVFPPTRWLLKRLVLPSPGQGPSRAQRARSAFRVQLYGEAHRGDGTRVCATATVAGGDPGYGDTAKMLTETAVCLALHGHGPRAGGGGHTTTAACPALGRKLIARLRDRAGMVLDVTRVVEKSKKDN